MLPTLALALSLAGTPVAAVYADTPTDLVTIKVGSGPPPPETVVDGPSINPSTRDLKEPEAAAPVADPNVVLQPGQAAPSFRTLSDAAEAGVNPLAPVKTADLAVPVTEQKVSWLTRLWPVGAVIAFLALLGGAYVVLSPHIRRVSADE
jgi:hypothetical protein